MWDFHSFAFIWLGFYYFSFSVLVGSARSYFEKPNGTNYVRNNVSSSCEWRPYKKAIVGMVVSFLSNMFSLVNCDLFKCVIGKEYRYIYLCIFFKGLVIPCSTLLGYLSASFLTHSTCCCGALAFRTSHLGNICNLFQDWRLLNCQEWLTGFSSQAWTSSFRCGSKDVLVPGTQLLSWSCFHGGEKPQLTLHSSLLHCKSSMYSPVFLLSIMFYFGSFRCTIGMAGTSIKWQCLPLSKLGGKESYLST